MGNSLPMCIAYGLRRSLSPVMVMVERTFKIEGSCLAPTSGCVNEHEHGDSKANSRKGCERRDDRVERRRDGEGTAMAVLE